MLCGLNSTNKFLRKDFGETGNRKQELQLWLQQKQEKKNSQFRNLTSIANSLPSVENATKKKSLLFHYSKNNEIAESRRNLRSMKCLNRLIQPIQIKCRIQKSENDCFESAVLMNQSAKKINCEQSDSVCSILSDSFPSMKLVEKSKNFEAVINMKKFKNAMLKQRSPVLEQRTPVLEQKKTLMLDQRKTRMLDQKKIHMLDQRKTRMLDQKKIHMLDQRKTRMLDQKKIHMLDQRKTRMLKQRTAVLEQRTLVLEQKKTRMLEQKKTWMLDQRKTHMLDQRKTHMLKQRTPMLEQKKSRMLDQRKTHMLDQRKTHMLKQRTPVLEQKKTRMLEQKKTRMLDQRKTHILQQRRTPMLEQQIIRNPLPKLRRISLQKQGSTTLCKQTTCFKKLERTPLLKPSKSPMLKQPLNPWIKQRNTPMLEQQCTPLPKSRKTPILDQKETPLSMQRKTPLFEQRISMREKLIKWLEMRGKTPSRYRHLTCYEVGDNVHNTKYSQLLCSESTEGDILALQSKFKEITAECLSLLDMGFPAKHLLSWLDDIVTKIPCAKQFAHFWICKAHITASLFDDITVAISILDASSDANIQPKEDILQAKSQLLAKNNASGGGVVSTCKRLRSEVQHQNVFVSSDIKYLCKTFSGTYTDSVTPQKYIVTPVRRSTRKSFANLVDNKHDGIVVESIGELPFETRRSALFRSNIALDCNWKGHDIEKSLSFDEA